MNLPASTSSANAKPKILLGRIAPAVLLIFLLLDISLRFLPPAMISFRAWEALRASSMAEAPFIPNAFYHNRRSYGDLANLANLPRDRQYRDEEFTTDAAGYRNRFKVTIPFSGILLIGSSFTAGAGVSDAQTLSEQLHDMSRCMVYNGGETPDFPGLLQHLKMDGGLVIAQQLGRDPLPERDPLLPVAPEHQRIQQLVHRVLGSAGSDEFYRLRKRTVYSPLAILSGRALKTLQNDELLPNPYRGAAVESRLRNGKEMLFLSSEVDEDGMARKTDPEGFVQLKAELQKRGIGLLVLLVPDKYDTYRDLLDAPPRQTDGTAFLDVVEQRLIAADVPVVNLRKQFRKQAGTLLDHDDYLFWLDDTHWNAEGIREAAEAIESSRVFSQIPCR